ncbi:hypothetical protein Tco_0835769 [Tanacetum coccineum]
MENAGNEAVASSDNMLPTLKSCLKASRIHNINGKMMRKYGNPLRPVLFVTSITDQAETLDEQHVRMENAWDDTKVEESDCLLLVENVMAAQNKFANSLVGFFVGKSVAFPLFTSVTGLEQVLEKGPWMIHNQPLMLTKWTPNLSVSMDNVAMVPVWVKIHKVPMVAYSEDGLSLITTQIGKPILLDSFTSSMCKDPWGQIGYARALIEISNETDLKKEVIMAILIIDGEGYTKEKIKVEYKWRRPFCSDCHVFGHAFEQCPKRIKEMPKPT